MDSVIDLIDSIKTKITDQEYINIMASLQSVHKEKYNSLSAIPNQYSMTNGQSLNLLNTGRREIESITFDVGGEYIATLDVPGHDYPSEDIYSLSMIMDSHLEITRSGDGWIINTDEGVYTKSKIPIQTPDGSYGYKICDENENKHSILDLASEIWYDVNGICRIKKWHTRGKLVREIEC